MARIKDDFSGFPKIYDIARWQVNCTVARIAGSLPAGTKLLDAGAGEGAYRKLFSHCEYRSIDMAVGEAQWDYSALDYVAPLDKMPIETGAFDAVLCTQVLEHLEKPRESVAEMFRVLRPGGVLYITVPMAQGEHQVPYDFFRYTSYGLKSICSGAGFSEVKVSPLGGMPARLAYELPALLNLFPPLRTYRNFFTAALVLFPLRTLAGLLVRGLQHFLLWADRFDAQPVYPYGWAVTAIKK